VSDFFKSLSILHQEDWDDRTRQILQDFMDQVSAMFGAARITNENLAEGIETTIAAPSTERRGVIAFRTTGSPQTIGSSTTPSAVSFAATQIDSDGWWNSAAPTRLTLPTRFAGTRTLFDILMLGAWDANATGYREIGVARYNSAGVSYGIGLLERRMAITTAAIQTYQIISMRVNLVGAGTWNEGDYLQLEVAQNSGANRTWAGSMQVYDAGVLEA
jgi:hypothetical protein